MRRVEQNPISSDPSVMMGKSVVAGAYISGESILEKLAVDESKEQTRSRYSLSTRD